MFVHLPKQQALSMKVSIPSQSMGSREKKKRKQRKQRKKRITG